MTVVAAVDVVVADAANQRVVARLAKSEWKPPSSVSSPP
jgi:hypothetical protein